MTCSVDVGKSPDIPYVYVSHDGLVRNYKPIQVVTACTLNIYNFPFDVQKCSLTFQSWLHTSKAPPLTVGAPRRGASPSPSLRLCPLPSALCPLLHPQLTTSTSP